MEFNPETCIEQIVFEIFNLGEEYYLYLQEVTTQDKIAMALLGDPPCGASLDVYLSAAKEYAETFLTKLERLEKEANKAAMEALDDPDKEFDIDLPIACKELAFRVKEEFVIEKFMRIARLMFEYIHD